MLADAPKEPETSHPLQKNRVLVSSPYDFYGVLTGPHIHTGLYLGTLSLLLLQHPNPLAAPQCAPWWHSPRKLWTNAGVMGVLTGWQGPGQPDPAATDGGRR